MCVCDLVDIIPCDVQEKSYSYLSIIHVQYIHLPSDPLPLSSFLLPYTLPTNSSPKHPHPPLIPSLSDILLPHRALSRPLHAPSPLISNPLSCPLTFMSPFMQLSPSSSISILFPWTSCNAFLPFLDPTPARLSLIYIALPLPLLIPPSSTCLSTFDYFFLSTSLSPCFIILFFLPIYSLLSIPLFSVMALYTTSSHSATFPSFPFFASSFSFPFSRTLSPSCPSASLSAASPHYLAVTKVGPIVFVVF